MRQQDLLNANKARKSELGSFLLFFVAGVLPLLIFMLALSVDVASYLRANQRLQKAADDAALLAWRYLPYQSKAQKAVTNFLTMHGMQDAVVAAQMAPARPGAQNYSDEFEVILAEPFPLSFMSYFDQRVSLPLRAVARTRSTPLDVFIAVDRSDYMAPSQVTTVWPGASPAPYFGSLPFANFVDPFTGIAVDSAPVLFMTQRCFNPYFSEAKRIAIGLYEYLAASGRNGVGLGVFPGVQIEALRPLRPLLRPAQFVETANRLSGEAHALQLSANAQDQDFYVYAGSTALGASSWCAAAAAADSEFSFESPYGVGTQAVISKLWSAPNGSLTLASDIVSTSLGTTIFNPDYQSALSVRESLWSAVAKATTPNSRAVLDQTIAQFASGPDFESVNGTAIRGGLTGTATQTAIILAGDVPHYEATRFNDGGDIVAAQLAQSFAVIRSLVSANKTFKVKILYVVMNDESRPLMDTPPELAERSERLGTFFAEQQNLQNLEGRLELQVLRPTSFKVLNEEVLSYVVLDNHRRVLSF